MKKFNKITVFRLIYLLFTVLTFGFSVFLMVRDFAYGLKNQIDFNLIIDMVSVLFCGLFEISVALFIVRSLSSRQTLLIKNVVFKRDGSPFFAGVLFTVVSGTLLTALSVLMVISAAGANIFTKMIIGAQLFIADVTATLGVNLLFCFIYFLLFRHEAGTFELI